MGINRGMFSSASDRWFTPPDLLGEIRDFLGGDFYDPCPASLPGDQIGNGLWQSWAGRRCFVNPPYGRVIGKWIAKALTEPVDEVVLLVPSRTGSPWFAPLFEHTVCFIRGRLRFSGSHINAPFDSALVYRGPRGDTFAAAFAHRGVTIRAVATAQADLWTLGGVA